MKKLMLFLTVLPAFALAQTPQQCSRVLHDVMETMVYPGVCPNAPAELENTPEEAVYNLMTQADRCEAVFEGEARVKMQAELDAAAVERSQQLKQDPQAFCRSQIQRTRATLERYRP